MSRKTKMSKCLQEELKNGVQKTSEELLQSSGSLDVSSIEKASFLQGEQYSSHGNPLHSTALEGHSPEPNGDQMSNAERNAGKGRADHSGTVTPKRLVRSEKGLAKTKQKSGVQEKLKSSNSTASQRPSQQTHQAPKYQTRHTRTISESKEKRRKSADSEVSGAAVSNDPTTDGSAGVVSRDLSQQRQFVSSEELTDEDESFDPNNEKRRSSSVRLQKRQRSFSRHLKKGPKQKRKSSSGSSDGGNLSKKTNRAAVRNLIDLDVILEAFQQFVTEYKETVNSEPVKQAIDTVSHSFEEQLNDMITAAKECSSAKRSAVKINSTLNCKKSRLLEVKNELIKTEAELGKLQKEYGQLEQRLTALTQGTTFLTNLKELNRRYLQQRSAHPEDPETYGPSCLPAMLLEARSIMGTENQLKMINDKMQQYLEETGHK
ncbi:centromere protein U isoform X1 [Electrophorus electricus]|uniref:centromere protein U isoform X1 n=1 Tax=Electrophorus electricus TaxID=8005 RepID=UPI0015CFFCDF|nr:centromere protein U isoform X1 [Electrophorus electricus]